jgi:hypothetical protein
MENQAIISAGATHFCSGETRSLINSYGASETS